MAPKTPLAARTPAYLAQYGRTLGAAYRFERIQKEVGDEQARVQYLDSIIGQERQTLAGLQQVFRTEPLSFEAAQSLLGDLTAAERGKALAGAQGAAARKAATTLSKDERATLISAYAQNPELGFSAAEALITGATPEKGHHRRAPCACFCGGQGSPHADRQARCHGQGAVRRCRSRD